jgi:Protein of unknown function (DUF2939)
MDDAIGAQPDMTLSPAVHDGGIAAPATPPSRPAKSRTPLIIAALVLIALLVGAGLWWLDYTRSPAYSIGQLAQAVQDRDWNGVQKYVDIDAVVGQVVDAAVGKSTEGGTSGLEPLLQQLAGSAKPALVQRAKDALRQAIESGGSWSGYGLGSLVGVCAANQVKSVDYIGDEALVAVAVPYGGKVFDVRLRMKRVDDHWRVTAIENVLDLSVLGLRTISRPIVKAPAWREWPFIEGTLIGAQSASDSGARFAHVMS